MDVIFFLSVLGQVCAEKMSLESLAGVKTSTMGGGGGGGQAQYQRPAPGATSFLDDGGIEVQLAAGTAVVDSVAFENDADGGISMEDHKDDARHYAGLMTKDAYEKKKQVVLEATETHEEKVVRLEAIERAKKEKARKELEEREAAKKEKIKRQLEGAEDDKPKKKKKVKKKGQGALSFGGDEEE